MFVRDIVKVRIPVHQIIIGMYVSELDRLWTETPFLFQGFEITSAEEVSMLSEFCEHIFIDIRKSKISPDSPLHRSIQQVNPVKSVKPRRRGFLAWLLSLFQWGSKHKETEPETQSTQYEDKVSVLQEMPNAEEAYKNLRGAVDHVLASFKSGGKIDARQAHRVIDSCVTSLINNKDSLLWFTLIKDRDKYTSEHCMNVAILAIAFGRHLGLPEDQLNLLGMCGMMHDIGKIKVPLEVLNKEGFFTEEEFELMKLHTTYGKEFLEQQEDIPPEVIQAVYGHHEKTNGAGYPNGQSGSEIPYYARIVAIVDAYDAITSDRSYQKSRATLKAQKILYKAAGSHFDAELIRKYIQWLGIYPPGSVIEMSNGEAGFVLSVYSLAKLQPRVILMVDKKHAPQTAKIVDLAKEHLDEDGNTYKVKTSHPNGTYGIQLSELQKIGYQVVCPEDQEEPSRKVA